MLMQEMTYSNQATSLCKELDDVHLVGCPTCGRAAKVRPQWLDTEIACAHCSATFIVTELMDGSKLARSTNADKPETEREQPTVEWGGRRQEKPLAKTHAKAKSDVAPHRPIAFLVEPRDENYARLAGDLVEAGFRPVRAMSVTDALKACGKYRPLLVLADISLSEQKAWQMAPKLALLDSDTRVWLYDHAIDVHDYAMADFLGIEQLIEHGGDLFRLSSRVRQSLSILCSEKTTAGRTSVASR
ncbi:hypothetical protein Enr13x_74240 [Stieleria neptunia]|uniref:Uncharacterized protein n=1 Tax=Stieleria neptunia TaxID=2527979 RepID=A0A518I384_9BACT|nr:hypothetical protein [Stieleria neptunia]QDV47514.1 hypothetical protein Enr13x_74240 [Stieleria neptunia]